MHTFISNLFFVFYFLLCGFIVPAQQPSRNFERLTNTQGLSNNKVNAVLQDWEGFYWISTKDGLNRFDGTSFKVYRNEKNNSGSLIDNTCSALLEDNEGNIWVGTYKGLSVYQKKSGIFKNIILSNSLINKDIVNRIGHLALDKDGNVWIGSWGLWKYDTHNNVLTNFIHNDMDSTSISGNSEITAFAFDKFLDGIWFTVAGQINFLQTNSMQFYHYGNNPRHWKIFNSKDGSPLTLDQKGRLWFYNYRENELQYFVGPENSIGKSVFRNMDGIKKFSSDDKGIIWISYWTSPTILYNPDTEEIDNFFLSANHSQSALSDQFNNLFIDRDKNYWISSGNGISILKPSSQFYQLYTLNKPASGDLSGIITCITEKEKDILWLGTITGLYEYNVAMQLSRRIKAFNNSFSVTCLYYSKKKKQVWLGSGEDLYIYDVIKNKIILKTRLKNFVQFIIEGKAEMWVGTWRNGLYKLNNTGAVIKYYSKTKNKSSPLLSNNLITANYSDKYGLWIGYNSGYGYAHYDEAKDSFINYNVYSIDTASVTVGTTNVITTDKKGNLWLGSHGGGIYYWDKKNNTYTEYGREEGLSDNYIKAILPDKHENLWICNSAGVDVYYQKAKKIIPLLIDFEYASSNYSNSGYASSWGIMFFHNGNRILAIDPEKFRYNKTSPQPIISVFRIFEHEVPFERNQSKLDLNYKQNFFSFEFSSLKTNPSEAIKYAYMLEGFDKNWNYISNRHFASYTNVPAGSYNFRLKCANELGMWSDRELIIPVIIHPPFWKTWWFYSLLGLAIIGILYSIYRYRINQLKKLLSLRTKISQDLHDDVGASLSSIHIYSSVAEKLMQEQPQKAKELMQQINRNTKDVMENMNDIVWALNNEKDDGRSFINRIKNFGYDLLAANQIECYYDFDEKLMAKITNPEAKKNLLLIIKEAMNNISKYSGATRAEIWMGSKNGLPELVMTDNGKGFEMNKVKRGNGLNNINYRTHLLKGDSSIVTAAGNGVTITCRFPVTIFSNK